MANPKVKFKRSSVANKRPTLDNIELGELALNTYDGKLFTRQDTGGVGIATTVTLVNPWTESYGGGTISYSGVVTATSFSGDGSNLTGISAGAPVSISTVAPSSPSAGDLWFDPNYGRTVVYYDEATVGYGTSKYWIDPSPVDTDNITIIAPSNLTVSGIVTATSFVKSGGTSSQFLKADGSVDSSTYITSADGGNAATLDSLDSTQFLRSDAADTKTSGDLTFSDDVKLKLGTGSDLQIYHNGSNSYIDDGSGTGALIFKSNTYSFRNAADNEQIAVFNENGSVELWYDNSKKFETTSSGVTVSGDVTINDKIIHNGDTNTAIRFPAADTFTVETGGSERARFDSSGNFGLGTSSPVERLHVAKSAATGPSIYITNDSTGHTASDGLQIGYDGSNNVEFRNREATQTIFYNGNTERMRITSSGKVGINGTPTGEQLLVRQSAVTSAPSRSAALYLENNGNCEIQFVGNSSNDCQLRFGTSSNSFKGALEYQLDNNALLAYVNGSERMRIDSSGRLLVGAASGTGKFIVQDSSLPKIQSNFNGTKHFEMGVGGSGGGLSMTTGHFLTINHQPYANRGSDANLTERFRIGPSGQIGLGGANYGTSGQVLTSNGSSSAPTWQDAGGGAWNLITTVNASNVATADVTGTSSTYDKYCIIGRNIRGATAGAWLFGRYINNGTVVTASNYKNAWNYSTSSSTGSTEAEPASSNFRAGRTGDTADEVCDLYMYFNNTHSGSTSMFTTQGFATSYDGVNTYKLHWASSLVQSFTNISGIRFYNGSGNIHGTFQLYGIS